MGLKLLHTADWHLDSPFSSFAQQEQAFLKQQLSRLPQLLAAVCRKEGCDLVLLSGDIFDGKPSRTTVDALRTALCDCGVPVLISPGNHDFISPDSPWVQEIWPENVHIFTEGITSLVLPELSCRIYGAGYTAMDCPALLDGFHAEGAEQYCIGLFHGDPTSASSPCCPITAAQVRESGFDYLALGHIHKAGSFRAGNTLCAWPGCPMGRGWDETGEKGFSVVTLNAAAEVQFYPLGLPRFFDISADVQELEGLLPPAKTEDFYRIAALGMGPLPSLSHISHLTLRDERISEDSLWAQAEKDSLRGLYFSMLRNAPDTEAALLAARICTQLLDGQEVSL